MKVLFAVSNEEISESIVKRYQKQYKEIISYKNVYYFNAILKELQRDKTYDRIVISEDLETFSHTQYGQIDKFIFEKLDGISDEAFNQDGDTIPIILICTDRRTKSDQMLSKFFGIGIYNAVIGNDRSIEEVCNLIRKPRSKRDAKAYYKIESEDVKYEPESENDVSEVEIQNILAHFKRLGKNEEKYVESFDNIATQYNDVQLKVICKFLPLNVRAVLEEKSPKYQKLISYNKKISKDLRKAENVEKVNKGTTEKLLKLKDHENIMSNPVVIPSAVKMDGTKRLTKAPRVVQPSSTLEDIEKVVDSETADVNPIGFEKQEQEENQVQARSEIIDNPQNVVKELETTPNVVQPKKRRGRPPKKQITGQEVEQKPKRGRGRPPKNQKIEENTILPGFEDFSDTHVEKENDLPGFEDIKTEKKDEDIQMPGFDDYNNNSEDNTMLPGFEDYDNNKNEEISLPGLDDTSEFEEPEVHDSEAESTQEDFYNSVNDNFSSNYNDSAENRNMQDEYLHNDTENHLIKNQGYEEVNNVDISNLLTSDKKIACFVGTSKNGTSFIINNIAQILSNNGINTAILDTTGNRNSYYIYTKNEEELRKISSQCIDRLIQGQANGIKANKNLTVYTDLPNESDSIKYSGQILETLVKNHSLVLIDCDFNTPFDYFKQAQEIYLVQSMDVLTIQPLTAFLRELKAKNILDEAKLKIVLNKVVKVRGVNEQAIIGGMAYYNDPAMSYMTELFDRALIKYISIPFDEEVYANYLGSLVDCEISLKRYPKNIVQSLNELANVVYPLISGKSTYKPPAVNNSGFSPSINSTLNRMRKY